MNKKAVLIVAVLLFSLSPIIAVTGFAPNQTYVVGWEESGDFTVGTEHSGIYSSPWDRGGWALSFPSVSVNPSSLVAHSGSLSAKLTISNTGTDVERRIELLHDWDPQTVEHLWLESWEYIPSSIVIDDFLALHRSLYERLWADVNGDGLEDYYSYNGFHLSLYPDTRASRETYNQPIFVISVNHGDTLDGSLDSQDYYPSDDYQTWSIEQNKFVWNTANGQPKCIPVFDQWFGVRTYVYRDLNAVDVIGNNGILKMWLNFGDGWELVFERINIRTIGIDPSLLAMAGVFNDANGMGYLASGISVYSSINSAPKTVYFDDVILSSEKDFPSDASSDPRVVVVGILTVTMILVASAMARRK